MREQVDVETVHHCVICLKIFERRKDLFRHVVVHGERFRVLESEEFPEFKCENCSSRFIDEKFSKTHDCDKPKIRNIPKWKYAAATPSHITKPGGKYPCPSCDSVFQVCLTS